MRYFINFLLLLYSVLSLTGCSTLVAENIKKNNDSWEITINKIYDDATYRSGGSFYFAPGGHRYIQLNISIHNKSGSSKSINLSRFILREHGEIVARPSIVDMDNPLFNIKASTRPTLSPGESITRNLYYSFPYDVYPTQLDVNEVGPIKLPRK